MRTEKGKLFMYEHISEQEEKYRTGIYQRYATEELYFNDDKAKRFATAWPNYSCDTEFTAYRTTTEINRFDWWYYINYCSQFFFNGFEQWLKTHHRILQYLTQDWDIESGSDGQEENRTNMYQLVKAWTSEFESQYRGQDWSTKDFDQTISAYCEEKLGTGNSLYTYLNYNHTNIFRMDREGIHDILDSEIHYALTSFDRNICFIHPCLKHHADPATNEANATIAYAFYEKHLESGFVLNSFSQYFAIGVSILCTDQNIINDLKALDKNGTL